MVSEAPSEPPAPDRRAPFSVEQTRSLIETYRQESARCDPSHGARLLHEAGRLYEEVLDDPQSALEAVEEALALDPTSPLALATGLRLLLGRGLLQRAAQLVRRGAEASRSAGTRSALLFELARIEERLGDEAATIAAYQQLHADDPGNLTATEALVRFHLGRGDWEQAQILCQELALAEQQPLTRCSLLLFAALLAPQPEEQQRLLSLCLSTGELPELVLALTLPLVVESGDWQRAVGLMQPPAEQGRSASLYYQLSWILAEQLGRTGEAIEQAGRALELDPDQPLLWDWLGRLLAREARWEDLVPVLQRLAGLADEATRLDHHLAAAEVLEHRLHRPEDAIVELKHALGIDPDSAFAVELLQELYARTRRWDDLLALHLRQAEREESAADRAEALYRAARIQHEQRPRLDEATTLLERAVDLEPRHGAAHRLLERLYREQGRWGDLVRLLRKQLEVTESANRRSGLLMDVAALQEHRLGDAEAALEAHREGDELPPDPLHRLWAVVRLGESTGDATAAAEALHTLESRLETAGERAAVALRLARLIEERLGDPAAALPHCQRAEDLDPSLPGVRQTMQRLLIRLGRWPDLVQHLKVRLAAEPPPERRHRIARRIAWLLERRLGRPAEAVAAYREALEVAADPALRRADLHGLLRVTEAGDLEQLPDLEPLQGDRLAAAPLVSLGQRLLDGGGNRRHARVALSWAQHIDPDSTLAGYLLLRCQLRLGDWEAAIATLPPLCGALLAAGALRQPKRAHQLLRAHVDRPEANLEPAAGRLAVSRWLELLAPPRALRAEDLARRANLEPDPGRGCATLHRLANHAEQSDQETGAVEIYRRILADHPRDEHALLALERLARKREDPELVAEALERRVAAESPPARSDLQAALAGALLRAGRDAEAVELWRTALEQDPSCRPAYDALRCLYWERGDNEGLTWTLERSLDTVNHPRAAAVDLLQRAGFRHKRGDVVGALADLERLLDHNPGHPEAVDRIVALLRSQGNVERLAQRLERAAEHTASPKRQALLLLQLGALQRDGLDDPIQAQQTFSRAITADPNNVAALMEAAELQLELDQPTEALALFNRAALRADEDGLLLRAQLRIAEVCAVQLDDPVRARASLEEILGRVPDHRDALALRARLAESQGDLQGLERDLRRLVALTDDKQEQAALMVRLSEVLHQRNGPDGEEAQGLLDQAIALQPGDPDRLDQLVRSLEATRRWTELDALLERQIPELEPRDQLPFLLTRGRVLGRHLGQPEAARAILDQVLEDHPDNADALALLLDQPDDSGGLGDPERLAGAICTHRALLRRNPLTVESIRTVHRLCSRTGRLDESYVAGGCLVFLGEATEEERYFHAQLRKRVPPSPTGAIKGEQLQQLGLPLGDHPLRQLLALLRDQLPALLPADLGHYGLDSIKAARLTADHAAWDVASICSGAFKLGYFDLAEARGGAPHGACLPGDPPVLLLPRNFLRLPVPDQLFLCGRLLARIALYTEALDPGRRAPLRIRDLELLLAALLRPLGAPRDHDGPANILDDMERRLKQRLPEEELVRAQRLAEEASAPECHKTWTAWLRSTEQGACRAGLLCCGGLETLASFWTAPDGPLSRDLVRELILFSLSEEYANGRAALGLALPEETTSRGDRNSGGATRDGGQ